MSPIAQLLEQARACLLEALTHERLAHDLPAVAKDEVAQAFASLARADSIAELVREGLLVDPDAQPCACRQHRTRGGTTPRADEGRPCPP